MRRAVATLGALVAVAAGAPVAVPDAAQADDTGCTGTSETCVVVTWSGDSIASGSKTLGGRQLAASPPQGQQVYAYCLRPGCGPGAEIDDYQGPPGWPVRSIITELLGVAFTPESVTKLTISSPDTSKTDTLDGRDLSEISSTDYPFLPNSDGQYGYPYLYANGPTQVLYLRPQRDAGDPNAQFQVAASTEMDIDITVGGTVLTPTIRATSDSSIDVHGSVDFAASVPDVAGDATYTWDFGDGSPTVVTHAKPTVTHKYGRAGTFPATVSVTDTGGGAGDSVTPATVTVADPSTPKPTDSSTGGAGGTGRSNNPTVGPRSGSGVHLGAGSSSAIEGPTSSAAPRTAAPPTRTASASVAGPSSATSSSSAAGGAGLVEVHGILLDPDQAHAVASPSPRVGDVGEAPALRAGQPTDSLDVFGPVLAAIVVVLLIGGAVLERRRPARGPRRGRHA